MSTTLKQAIQALKGRIAYAYAAVANKGGTLPAIQDSANLPSAIESIPSGEEAYYYKEVTFIDHLGVVADYTIEEAMKLTELPTPKEYGTLVFDEWSMSLDEIQDGQPHTIAACYHTKNNEYRFGYTTAAGRTLIFVVSADKPCLVDFGDGTTDTKKGYIEHTYEEDGEYDIVLSGATITGMSFTDSNNSVPHSAARRGITYVEMPNTISSYNITTGNSYGNANLLPYMRYLVVPKLGFEIYYQVHSCVKTRLLALPNNINEVRNIKGAFSVECMNIPKLVTSFNNAFPFYNLRKIVFEGTCKSVSIGNNSILTKCKFYMNEGVETLAARLSNLWSGNIIFPSSMQSICEYALSNTTINYVVIKGTPILKSSNTFRDSTIKYVYFTSPTPPTIEAAVVFHRYNKIAYVPLGSIDVYRASTNWAAAEELGHVKLEEYDYENSKIK